MLEMRIFRSGLMQPDHILFPTRQRYTLDKLWNLFNSYHVSYTTCIPYIGNLKSLQEIIDSTNLAET